ncbi:MAG TPA: phytoene/squalene synthase family protein [Chryseolinea sp.]|nr:phytoene/squalene synthase family protein [Chryseolinea sp.]
MKELFDTVSIKCSRLTTKSYSTSFSIGISCLGKELRDPVYSIYGFVRFADEIVDTFHNYDKKELLERFKRDTYLAIDERISLNPILNSFQATANQFAIEKELVDLFLQSMEMDLEKKRYDSQGLKQYILGSAEAVGLMCLRVFCYGNDASFEKLKPYAMSLGSAFQKVNFLRDLNADFAGMGRTYFPGIEMNRFDEQHKRIIEESIESDFRNGYFGIRQLPRSSRLGVYVAYVYYLDLFKKIKNTSSEKILQSRVRIRNRHKAKLLAYSFFRHQLNML